MGESRFSGWPCALVRLAGCHRRCRYCDTEYAFSGGQQVSVDDVRRQVSDLGFGLMMLTGGEPLLQTESVDLMAAALADGLIVVLETSGTIGARVALADVPVGVSRVVDVKTPGSGIAADQVDWHGLTALDQNDEIKLVITDRADYLWARELVTSGLEDSGGLRHLPRDVPVAFSPGWGNIELRDLAGWILVDRLPVRFQLQLHKVVWPEAEGGV